MSDDAGKQTNLDEIMDEYTENESVEKHKKDDIDHSPEPDRSERVETTIGIMPADWNIKRLDDICDINPDGFSEDDWDGETFEYISLSEASEGEILRSKTIPLDDAPDRAQRKIKAGDVLVGTVRPKQVSHGLVTEEHDGKICSSGFGVLRTGSDLNGFYLLQEVLSHRFFRQMEAYVAGSGYPAVNIGDLKKHRIGIPPVLEQRKIASILYNINQGIQKTEEIIEQTKRVREGLLQDVMERGVTKEGHLRPQPSEAGNLFEEKEGIRVPPTWKVEQLADTGDWVSGKTPKRSESSYWGGSTPWISAKDMKTLRVGETEDSITEIAVEDGATIVPSDSVLVLVRGMTLDHSLPIVRPKKDVSFNQDVKAILPHDEINPDYLAYWLESNEREILGLVTEASHGTKRLSTESLGNVPVSIPPLDEQSTIVDRIMIFDSKFKEQKSYAERLKRFKRGLMQDLLSGDIRTVDRDIDVLPEVEKYG